MQLVIHMGFDHHNPCVLKLAAEADDLRRIEWWRLVAHTVTDVRQLIFCDESSKDLRAAQRLYGFALRGAKARSRVQFGRGDRYSIIGACNALNGVYAFGVYEGTINRERFDDWFFHSVFPIACGLPPTSSMLFLLVVRNWVSIIPDSLQSVDIINKTHDLLTLTNNKHYHNNC
jgi:hypothetical protein